MINTNLKKSKKLLNIIIIIFLSLSISACFGEKNKPARLSKATGKTYRVKKTYTVKKGDTLSGIAKEQLGKAHRWKYLYELNKDRIRDPNKLKAGQSIIIPVE